MTSVLIVSGCLVLVALVIALVIQSGGKSGKTGTKSVAIPADQRDYQLVVEYFARNNQQSESFIGMLMGLPERPPYTFKGGVLHSGAGISEDDMAAEGKKYEKEMTTGAEIFEVHESGKPDVFLLLDVTGTPRCVPFAWGNQRYEEGKDYPLPGEETAEADGDDAEDLPEEALADSGVEIVDLNSPDALAELERRLGGETQVPTSRYRGGPISSPANEREGGCGDPSCGCSPRGTIEQ